MTQLEASKPNDVPARVTEVKKYLQRIKMTFRERSLHLFFNFGHKLYVVAGGMRRQIQAEEIRFACRMAGWHCSFALQKNGCDSRGHPSKKTSLPPPVE